ncbi:hypothetical protein CP533_1714 [Ophiocordyceps camponoti-saundersi (nom. inval.)]|nr:hypothetical protein CP533_1714 [Ophiocordyceps camponoti-saundersi (nom. inval.)]
MKLHQVISALAIATLVTSSPSPEPELVPRRGRPKPQGCHSAISDFCCVPGYCLCKGGELSFHGWEFYHCEYAC